MLIFFIFFLSSFSLFLPLFFHSFFLTYLLFSPSLCLFLTITFLSLLLHTECISSIMQFFLFSLLKILKNTQTLLKKFWEKAFFTVPWDLEFTVKSSSTSTISVLSYQSNLMGNKNWILIWELFSYLHDMLSISGWN